MYSWIRESKLYWAWTLVITTFAFAFEKFFASGISPSSHWLSSSISKRISIHTSTILTNTQLLSRNIYTQESNRDIQLIESDTLLSKMSHYVPYCFQFQIHNRKKLVLDLDETLISSSHKHSPKHDISINILISGMPTTFFVRKRPHVDEFLEIASQWFELVIFTASLSTYANAVIDKLDPKRRIKRRFYRQSCINKSGGYVKDLQVVCKDLSKVVIIDNSPVAYSINKENAIPIEDYVGMNHQDKALLQLIPLLEELRHSEDVRHVLKTYPKGACNINGNLKSVLNRKSNC